MLTKRVRGNSDSEVYIKTSQLPDFSLRKSLTVKANKAQLKQRSAFINQRQHKCLSKLLLNGIVITVKPYSTQEVNEMLITKENIKNSLLTSLLNEILIKNLYVIAIKNFGLWML